MQHSSKTRLDKAKQSKARQGKARQGKARQGNTQRQDNWQLRFIDDIHIGWWYPYAWHHRPWCGWESSTASPQEKGWESSPTRLPAVYGIACLPRPRFSKNDKQSLLDWLIDWWVPVQCSQLRLLLRGVVFVSVQWLSFLSLMSKVYIHYEPSGGPEKTSKLSIPKKWLTDKTVADVISLFAESYNATNPGFAIDVAGSHLQTNEG